MPKYRIVQDSYIDNVLYTFNPDPEKDRLNIHEIAAHHVPGPHWEPMDDEAKAICKKNGIAFTGFVPDCMDKLTGMLADSMKKADEAGSPGAIGAAVVDALVKNGVIKGKSTPAPAEV